MEKKMDTNFAKFNSRFLLPPNFPSIKACDSSSHHVEDYVLSFAWNENKIRIIESELTINKNNSKK